MTHLIQVFYPHHEVVFLQLLYRLLVIPGIKYRRQDLGNLSGRDVASCKMIDELVSRIARGSHGRG